MFQKFKSYFNSFVQLTEEEWENQEQYLSIKYIKKNELLVKEGVVCLENNFINAGTFRTYNIVDGKEMTTNFFFTGFVTDYISLINRTASEENIQALEDAELVTIPFFRMQELYDKYYNYQKFGRLVGEKLFTNMYLRQRELLLNTPKERYLRLIQKRPKVIKNLPQIYIASYLGITPEYLSRLKRELKNEKS